MSNIFSIIKSIDNVSEGYPIQIRILYNSADRVGSDQLLINSKKINEFVRINTNESVCKSKNFSFFKRLFKSAQTMSLVQANGIFDVIDKIILGKNQLHIIDLNQEKIAHVLLPSGDDDWFLNDINTQQKIQKGNYSIKTPLISFVDKRTPYFITDYIVGDSYGELTHVNKNEIILELFEFYSNQKEFIKKSFYNEFNKIKNEIYINLKELESTHIKILQSKVNKLYKIIEGKLTNSINKDVYYINIVHGDLNYRENIIKNRSGAIYFIDWEMSRSGNILYDYFYMMLFELNQFDNIEDTLLFNYFKSTQLTDLVQLIEKKLGLKINEQKIIDYFYLSITDMILYKLLIIKKKRIKPINKSEIKSRIFSLEKYINKITKVLNKAIKDNEKIS